MSFDQIVLCMGVGAIAYFAVEVVRSMLSEARYRAVLRRSRKEAFRHRHEPRDTGYPTTKELDTAFSDAVMDSEYRTLCRGGVEDQDRERDRGFFERLHEIP